MVAALRAAGALLGADLGPGARVLLQDVNSAMAVVLATHNAASSAAASSLPVSTFLDYFAPGGPGSSKSSSSDLSSSGSHGGAAFGALLPPLSRARMLRERRRALGACPYPLRGQLGERLEVTPFFFSFLF